MEAGGPQEFESNVSAFGGHDLAQIAGIPASVVQALTDLYITDAEQLVAVAAVEGAAQPLAEQLWISFEELEAVLEAARAVVPPQAIELQPAGEADLSMGAFVPTDEVIAETHGLPMLSTEAIPVSLPPAVSWVERMPPIRNQAARGTCVAFAVTAMHEHYAGAAGRPEDFSEQHLYYETKQIDGAPTSCGTWIVKAIRALAQRGQCRESAWAYNPNTPCNNHGALPANARTDGAGFKLGAVAVPAKDVSAIKAALAAGGVVPFSVPVYDSWYRSAATRNTGRLTMRLGSEQAAGGHAMCLVGYQDDEAAPGGGYFILRNSWGNWAPQSPYGAGYGTIPYQYIATDCWEACTAVVARPTPAENLVTAEYDVAVEFVGRGLECWATLKRLRMSNREAAQPVSLERLQLRSWSGTKVIDELVCELDTGTGDEGTREVVLTGLRLKANGTRTSWNHRITWECTYRTRAAAAVAAAASAPASAGGEISDQGAERDAGSDDADSARTITIDAGAGADIVIRAG